MTEDREPRIDENATVPSIAPPGKSFPVPPDKNPGGTIPDGYLPQTGADRPTGYTKP